jgi:sphingosine kinase
MKRVVGFLTRRNTRIPVSVIAAASGDGLIHEVINGFAARPDAKQALRIPIVQIPTGT